MNSLSRFGVFFSATLLLGQSPSGNQIANNAVCSNTKIDAKGNVSFKCSGLTKEQSDILASIPGLLNTILAKQFTNKQASTLFGNISDQLKSIEGGVNQLTTNPGDPSRGLLVPAKDPSPFTDDWCESHIPKDWFRLYLGGFVAAYSGHPVSGIKIRDVSVLEFRDQKGAMAISAKVSSSDGHRIVVMRDNYFKLDDYFRKETPDASTLNVFDENSDEPVLHVRYLNSHAILVTGTFNENGITVYVRDKEVLTMPKGFRAANGCSLASGAALHVLE